MSFSSTATRKQVTFTSGTLLSPISTGIYIFERDQVEVKRTRDGTDTTLTLDTHYEIDEDTLPGLAVVEPLVDAAESGDIWTIKSAIPIEQNSEYPNGAKISETALENDIDRTVALINQQQEVLNRTLRFSETATDAQIAGAEVDADAVDGYVLTAGAGGTGIPGWAAPSSATATGTLATFTTIAAMKAATGYTVGSIVSVSDGTARSGFFQLRNLAPTEPTGSTQGVELTAANGASYHWHRLHDGPIRVEWFGALGDGSTNDAAAIQAADDYFLDQSVGGVVLFGAATYVCNTQVTKSGNTFWRGVPGDTDTNPAGKGTQINCTDTTFDDTLILIQVPATATDTWMANGGMENIEFNGNRTNWTTSARTLMRCIEIKAVGTYGVRKQRFTNITIRDFYQSGFRSNGGGEWYFRDCYFSRCLNSLDIANISDSWFDSCHFGGGNNRLGSVPHPGDANGAQVVNCNSLTFNNCRFQVSNRYGLKIESSRRIQVTGGFVDQNEDYGIIVSGNSRQITIGGGIRIFNNGIRDGEISTWATTTAYVVGDYVEDGTDMYVCLVAHTSGTLATDVSSGYWRLVVASATTYKRGAISLFADANERVRDVIIDGVHAFDYARGWIYQFADNGDGTIRVYSSWHEIDDGDQVTISGTTNYDGTYTVSNAEVSTDYFDITATWVADDATGEFVKTNWTYQDRGVTMVKVGSGAIENVSITNCNFSGVEHPIDEQGSVDVPGLVVSGNQGVYAQATFAEDVGDAAYTITPETGKTLRYNDALTANRDLNIPAVTDKRLYRGAEFTVSRDILSTGAFRVNVKYSSTSLAHLSAFGTECVIRFNGSAWEVSRWPERQRGTYAIMTTAADFCNQRGKQEGFAYWDTTNGKPWWAVGSGSTANWKDGAGATVTPS